MEKPKQTPVDLSPDLEQAQDNERKAHCMALLEAALFVAGRPLDVNELCQVIGSRSKKKAIKYADTLIQEYKARNNAMEGPSGGAQAGRPGLSNIKANDL